LNGVIFAITPVGLLRKQHGVHDVTHWGGSSVGECIHHYVIFNHVVKKRKAY